MAERHRPDHRRDAVPRLWVAPSPKGTGADIWAEGDHRSRLGGDRTLLCADVPYARAHELVAGWNNVADILDPPQLEGFDS